MKCPVKCLTSPTQTHMLSFTLYQFLSPSFLLLLPSHRASEPQEISRIHTLKFSLQQKKEEELLLNQQITQCHEQLRQLVEDQENWAYPTIVTNSSPVGRMVMHMADKI